MRKIAGMSVAVIVLLGLIGAGSIASAAPEATPDITTAKTLHFDVVFSPFFYLDLEGPRRALESRKIVSRPGPGFRADHVVAVDCAVGHGLLQRQQIPGVERQSVRRQCTAW